MIRGTTALYGVMGNPVGHSASPAMHNAAFADLGIDAAYVPLPVHERALHAAVRGAHALGFSGLSVTVPHKESAIALCSSLDRVAVEVGAVNTLRRTEKGFEGFNTDAPACLALLDATGGHPLKGSRAIVLGAGGAARAAVWALLKLGVEVHVAARRIEAIEALAAHFEKMPGKAAPIRTVKWADASREAARAEWVVNATPIGLPGNEDGLPPLAWRGGQVAVDFVYGDTPFAAAAAEAGATVVRGEQILVRQGALAFTLWTGRPAPEARMAAAVAKSLEIA